MLIKKYKKTPEPSATPAATSRQGATRPAYEAAYDAMMPLPDVDELLGASEEELEATHPELPPVPWTPENAAIGLVPERRGGERQERRNGWRRGEEQSVISNAQAMAEQLKQEAKQQGFETGYSEGLQQAEDAIRTMKEQLVKMQAVEANAQQALLNEVIPLALQLAEKIMHTEVSCDPDLVITLAKAVLGTADPKQKEIMLKVHPNDLERVQKEASTNPRWQLNGRVVTVWEDPNVEEGGVVMETDSGQVDATFTTQIGLVRKLFALDTAIEPEAAQAAPKVPSGHGHHEEEPAEAHNEEPEAFIEASYGEAEDYGSENGEDTP
jgi:flagellar assembly protein FliH